MTRRARFVGSVVALAATLTACGTAAGSAPNAATSVHHTPSPAAPVVRKSAADMTPAEIDRFERAYSYAVAQGDFDAFNDSHFDHHRNRNHGFELTAAAPPTVMVGDTPAWGYRLLPWHRSFILEAEQMLRAALRRRDREEGRDPAEADGLFIPYWDVAHEQALPAWVTAFEPRGGTAMVPPELSPGHPLYGRPVGSRCDIHFGRWPGNNPAFNRLPDPPQVARILAHDDFESFYRGIESEPAVIPSAVPAAKQALQTLERRFPDNTDVKTVADLVNHPPQDLGAVAQDRDAVTKIINAALGVGYLATAESAKSHPDQEVIDAVKTAGAAVVSPPHVVLHLWAGGVDPANPTVRGTVSNFNELTVDPVFWMIHTELDRWWYTWEQSHTGLPPLTGEDASFQPIPAKQGAWYGGGRVYSLRELVRSQTLPYRYADLARG